MKLEKTVITDYLTHLHTRNFLDEKIDLHMKTDEKGILVLLDIDDFKSINDRYGHHFGDKVIVQVAKIITAHIDKDAIAARWGGEELAIYLPNASTEEGVRLAGHIGSEVERLTNPKVTLSSGVAMWNGSTSETVVDIFIRADKALYEAKNIGKNCVVKESVEPFRID